MVTFGGSKGPYSSVSWAGFFFVSLFQTIDIALGKRVRSMQ